MTHEDYRRALDTATREYEALGEKRREIDQRLAELAQSIATLTKLLGLTPTVPMGLTDAVRLVVRGAGVPMTPIEVRDRLAGIGFDVSKYVNDLAAVHTILKRLNEAGELRFLPRAPGKPQYMWNRPLTPVVLTKDIVQHLRENTIEREAAAAETEPEPPAPKRRARRSAPAVRARRTR
jgi:hypothetical protein